MAIEGHTPPAAGLATGPRDPERPIGVFDSGVGGLSVLQAIRAALPHEPLDYVADSAHAPYGDKDEAYILERSLRLIDFLRIRGAKAIVVACNTVTGLVIQRLRQHHADLPIVAIEPAVKPAALATRSGVVGVLATRRTVGSAGLARLVAEHARGVQVLPQACPGWVERVEQGDFDSPGTEAAVAEHLRPLLTAGADILVLGCTHYPFLLPVIRRVAGPSVQVINPAAAVARELARRLGEANLLSHAQTPGATRFWTSGDLTQAERVMTHLWQAPVRPSRLPAYT